MGDASDATLWDRSLAGDSAAFGALFDRHRDRVYRHARRLVEQVSDAEDLTAIAFLELWRRREAVRIVDGSVLPWLLVTTSNAARNASRARRLHARFLATLPAPEHVPDFGDDLAERLDREPRRTALSEAIRHLSPADQSLIALTEFEGLGLREASAAFGISYGAAKTRMSRARRRLGASVSAVIPASVGASANLEEGTRA